MFDHIEQPPEQPGALSVGPDEGKVDIAAACEAHKADGACVVARDGNDLPRQARRPLVPVPTHRNPSRALCLGIFARAVTDGTSIEECRIDSLAQSLAIIAGGADHARAKVALDSAFTELVRADDNIVRLLDPPFSDTPRDPGYIKAAPPGIGENGGQYSHAAACLGIAAAMVGDGDRAKLVFDRLNPVRHAASKEDIERYLIEPYVVAGDMGGTDPHCGRGEWSWYTGGASCTWRLAVEYILGVRFVDGRIALSPCLPAGWAGFSVTMRGLPQRHDFVMQRASC